jgi:hypothetical protein
MIYATKIGLLMGDSKLQLKHDLADKIIATISSTYVLKMRILSTTSTGGIASHLIDESETYLAIYFFNAS